MQHKITIIKNKLLKTLYLSFIFSLSFTFLTACSSTNTRSNKESAASYNAQLGAKYLQAGRLKLANEKLQKALAQDDRSSEVHHYFALLQQRIGEDALADKHFKKAVKINNTDPELLNNYGSHLCHIGRYSEAVKHFDQATKSPYYRTPEYAFTNAGICLRKQHNNELAESYFRKALGKNKNFGSALYQMAKLNYESGNLAKAQAFLLRYDEHNSPASDTLDLCVQINSALGDTGKVEECSQKKLQISPANR